MKDFPKVSIILACYNAEYTLKQTLQSIYKQSYSNYELIFINDGSKDNSLKIAQSFHKETKIQMHIINRRNKGFLYSLDEGIKKSAGTYIARIDADDLWDQQHLKLIMDEFDSDDELVLVGSNAITIDENDKFIGKLNSPTNYEDIIRHMHKDSPFIHSSVIFKKDIYNKTKGYFIGNDEGSKHIADYYLWFQLSKFGKCKIIQQHTLYYRYLDNSMSRIIDKCINYKSRYKVMSEVNEYYKKYTIYSLIQKIKLKIRIFQHCFLKKGNK